jgi:hypothetical protein
VPRRRLLQGAAAIGIAEILRPTGAYAESDDDERLGPFRPWSTPVNLGPVVNSPFTDTHAAISKDGLSLYFTSDPPGGVNGANLGNVNEIWVSKRASLDAPWQTPINLDAFNPVPVINSIGNVGGGVGGHNTSVPNLTPDGHFMFFDSPARVAAVPLTFTSPGASTSAMTSVGKSRSISGAPSTVHFLKTGRRTSRTKRPESSACISTVPVLRVT